MTDALPLALTLLALALPAAYLGYHIWLAAALWRRPVVHKRDVNAPWPSVSILVPARNEAEHIASCLESLLGTQYSGQWNILVGNDRSADATEEIVSHLARQHSKIELLSITTTLLGMAGKQNVLAQLAQQTEAELCLVVDADCRVAPSWVASVVQAFDADEVGLVSGPTVVEGETALAKLQALDWRYGMGSFQALAERGLPVTAVGNNMAWRRTAYQALGGYEALPFSLVEDYQLFRSMRAAGYAVRFPSQPALVNRSAAVGDLPTLVRQRRRWLRGAEQSGAPLHARLPFIVQLGYLGALLAAWGAGGWGAALAALGLKVLVDAAFLAVVQRRLVPGEALPWRWLLPHQLYLLLALLVLPLYLYWPGPTVWKGRAIAS